MTPQLALFSPEAEGTRRLREELDHLGAAYAALDDRYMALWQEARALRAALAQAQRQVEVWQAAAAWTGLDRTSTATGQALDATLKQLLALAHPDKWSAGQDAAQLAHELTILINHVRSQGELQP